MDFQFTQNEEGLKKIQEKDFAFKQVLQGPMDQQMRSILQDSNDVTT